MDTIVVDDGCNFGGGYGRPTGEDERWKVNM